MTTSRCVWRQAQKSSLLRVEKIFPGPGAQFGRVSQAQAQAQPRALTPRFVQAAAVAGANVVRQHGFEQALPLHAGRCRRGPIRGRGEIRRQGQRAAGLTGRRVQHAHPIARGAAVNQ